ncbi:protease modulator HflK [Cellvibrio zantedeschiae]|uniref:Protein HflK n=1 Tax=Cellvibrio zantedeschiae TaxID=1237077 RepID=A0ABQ3BAY5_9GAMM|nr:FtsH protease activity modulator HflK [Cellvibrio zantedeschiae]GGY86721.1 protease modulator HflK [Cellvibrio zantedeschiae]
MAWNEPGKDKDPWGGRGGGNDGPPDLDEAFKKLQDKLNGMFGGGSGGGSNASNNGSFGAIFAVIALVAVVLYGFFGIYTVDAKERAVVLRLGVFQETMTEGLHWSAPLLTQVFKVNVTGERQYPSKGLMLTQDESIVELPLTVQWNVADVKSYVLNVADPETSLKHATDSALRHVVGSTELEQVLSEGRAKMAAEVKLRLQTYLDNYQAGIQIINVNIQQAQPPEEVRANFDDVIKAKEDETRLKNEAESYSNGVIPEARGRAQRLLEEAEAYKSEVVSRAEGESARFENLLAEYKRAPEVTRKRLYIDAVESVMTKSSKVMVDVSNNSMLYLPLDKMTRSVPATVLEEAADARPAREIEAKPVVRRESR